MPPKLLALTDDQLTTVFRMATPLTIADRSSFLEDVARSLGGLLELGDGAVARTCREIQARYWKAHDLPRGRPGPRRRARAEGR